MRNDAPRIEAVVFDLFYTLVHPGRYPGATGRVGWLANMLGIDFAVLKARWVAFEPVLESGRAPQRTDGLGPELGWVRETAAELGVAITSAALTRIEVDWDVTQREALLNPPATAVATLVSLRQRGLRLGLLSNTHALESRAWGESPLASLFDVVALSHEIGSGKPDSAAFAHVLNQLNVSAARAAYVGDGGNDELAGARAAGFGLVILAEEAAATFAPDDLPKLRASADARVTSLADVVNLVNLT